MHLGILILDIQRYDTGHLQKKTITKSRLPDCFLRSLAYIRLEHSKLFI
jgi:hypothetical protein